MNDMSLSRCRIKSAKKLVNHIILQCTTWIPVENSGNKEFPVDIYIPKELLSNERIKIMGIKPGLDVSIIGKGFIDTSNNQVKINILLDLARRFDYAKNSQEAEIKLFDVIVTGYSNIGKYYQCMCTYKNQENSKDTKYIIVRTTHEPTKGCCYNFSGKFLFMRTPNGLLAPIAYADTFVKDIVLDERIQTKQ